MHVHQSTSQVCKPGELLALRKVKHPLNGRTSVSRLPLTRQDILSQYSGCFEGIGCFPGDPYVISTVFESKDKPTQMTKQSFTIIDFITYRKSIHFELIYKDVHNQ